MPTDGRAGRCNGLRAPAPRRAPVCACVCACLAAAFSCMCIPRIATMPNIRKMRKKLPRNTNRERTRTFVRKFACSFYCYTSLLVLRDRDAIN